jgi:5-methylcytosine-specific restriction endonuclease McrBC GTP-binding regulatory subunit McrB
VPSSVRRAFEETGVTTRDYLRFEVVEEFKRYRVSLFRPAAENVDVPPDDRLAFVSVRPSWSDHTALLGHYDATLERYMRTPVLELLLRADREAREAATQGRQPAPYFIVLDEMNIARIEHYFSDFLSALESRRVGVNGELRQESLTLHDADAMRLTWIDDMGVEYEIPQSIAVPTNVCFTGTLNLDDTTYGLSPKVVDRASTIAFCAVDFAGYLSSTGVSAANNDPLQLTAHATRELAIGEFRLSNAEDSREVADALQPIVQLNELLLAHDQHVGYRVLNDIGLYIRMTHELIGASEPVTTAAVDACIVQKVLPKFFMWEHDRGGLLVNVLAFCLEGRADIGDSVDLEGLVVDGSDLAWRADGSAAIYARSAGRLLRMLRAMQ